MGKEKGSELGCGWACMKLQSSLEWCAHALDGAGLEATRMCRCR
jgi:hypothetical protein